jgi:hypothetical protein
VKGLALVVFLAIDWMLFATILFLGDSAPDPSPRLSLSRFFNNNKIFTWSFILGTLICAIVWLWKRPSQPLSYYDLLLVLPALALFLMIFAARLLG